MSTPSRHTVPRSQQTGFTLVELLVVIGIIGILMAVTLVAINPIQQFQNSRNAQRQSDVTAILDAIYQYEAQNTGTVPGPTSGTTLLTMTAGTPTALSSTGINLCTGNSLVPNYIADLPNDPQQANPRTPAGSLCTAATSYTTGYTITRSASGNRFTVTAPSAENGATITATR
ncbi:MAG TPA: type II secretion system protein [Candidatus Microsaccharimonas sp.]|nr:type II secretion system protein [Candidatus Microsaccharimonas sp.]